MSAPRIFDAEHYENLNSSRAAVVSGLLKEIKEPLHLRNAADVGCGVGEFSKLLSDLGFRVIGVDGREENVAEARLRFRDITFRTRNAEDLSVTEMGTFDLVLCFGLLYHLENPFRAVRNLYDLSDKILLVESMCVPGGQSRMDLLDEGVGEDQGLNYVAFYPSEPCLIKMLYRAGFSFVYRLQRPPADERFIATLRRKRQRTFLVASKVALTASNLVLTSEPLRFATGSANPWETLLARLVLPEADLWRSIVSFVSVRLPRFLRRPWTEKREIVSWYMRRVRNRD